MDNRRHEGFTLIELLIVMVVIAILSIAMMISGEEVSDTARATRIINDLNAWKRAALAYWADNPDEVSAEGFNVYNHRDDIIRYLNIDKKVFDEREANKERFRVIQSKDGCWYIWYDIGWGAGKIIKSMNYSTGITPKLVARAKSAGLYRATGENSYSDGTVSSTNIEGEKGDKFYLGTNEDGGERYIIMKVR